MASGLEIVFPVKSVYEMESASKTIQDMQSALSGKASNLKLDFGKIDPGESLVGKLGGYQQFFDVVRKGAVDVGKLATETTIMKNALTGDTVGVATKEMYTLKGATGETSTTFKDFSKEAEIKIQKLKSLGYVLEATSKEEANVARVQKMGNDAIRDAEKATISATTAAEKYLSKSKNMGGQQVQTAKQAAQAVLDQARAISTLDKTSQKYADGFAKLIQLQRSFGLALEGTKAGANVFQNFTNRIANAVQQTIAYSFSIGLVYKAQQLLNDAVKYAIDLNTEMTKIQVLQAEGAKTPEEINTLANSFNKLGQEMGASTLEIAKGSVEWFRQGRTVDETQKLMKASMMLSKLGAMESADATNYLTSITNAFKVSVNDTVTVVDKLIAVDNIAATSAGELATALRYTSESAALAGVGMEQLISYIGTVSTVTRQNAEMIGQAFKTMFARMTLIQGGGTDEEGWTISKVQKSLDAVGISMKEADGTFRNMGDVLEDTAAKWDTLGERERIEIAVAIGGVRQKEAFLVLMDNMDKALQYQAAQFDATGLAMDRYGKYVESIQAKQGKLTASMQELYASLINSNTVSIFYDIAIGMVQTITQGKLLIPILLTILYLMIRINAEKIKGTLQSWVSLIGSDLTKATSIFRIFTEAVAKARLGVQIFGGTVTSTTGIVKGFSTVLNTIGGAISPVTAILLAVGLAIGGIIYIVQKAEKELREAKKRVEDFGEAMKGVPRAQVEMNSAISDSIPLLKKQESGMKLTEEEAKKLEDNLNKIHDVLPTLNWEYVNGKPQLDATALAAANVSEELIKMAWLQTGVTGKDFGKTMDANNKEYAEEIGLLIQAQDEIEFLTQAQEALNRQKLEPDSTAWKDFIEDIGLINPFQNQLQWKRDLKEQLENTMNNPDELSLIISEGMSAANAKAFTSTSSVESMKTSWKQLLSIVWSGTDETSKSIKNWIKTEADSGNHIMKDVWDEQVAVVNKANEAMEKAEEDRLNRKEEIYAKMTALELELSAEQRKSFGISINAIDGITKAMNEMLNATDDAGKAKALITLDETVNKLNEDLQLPPGLLAKMQYALNSTDSTQIQNVVTEIINWIAKNDDLASQIPNISALLTGFANQSINSFVQSGNAMVLFANQQYSLSADAFQQYITWLGEALWNLYGQGKESITMTANDGTQIVVGSAANITTVLSTMYGEFTNYIVDSTNTAAGAAAGLAKLIADILKGLTSGKPFFVPKVPTFTSPPSPGGGGPPKKDPRVAALEKQIKEYEDQIELLQEQLEIYDEQIQAIDRLIEVENRKKEVLQRQIDIYEEQKNDIDHQIDLLQQQIDLIDRQVEMLNRQTEEIDRQIEMYGRQINQIDRQIEMYERQKDLIDEQIALQEKLIEPLEAQKDAIDKQLESFKDAIDLQKEALQLRKEEADFLDELTKKNKALANLEAEIAIASLDTSGEGIARRLKLEEEAAKAKEDLAKTQEERAYDLQIRGLDDAYAAFEESMNAQKALLDDQIAKINEIIDNYNKQKEAIDALIAPLEAEKVVIGDIVYALEQQKIPIEDAIYNLEQEKLRIEDLIYPLEQQKIALDALIYPLQEQQEEIDLIIQKYEDEKQAIEDLKQPIEDQIELIGDKIEVLQDELDKINEIKEAIGGGGGLTSAYNDHTLAVKLAAAEILGKWGEIGKAIGLTQEKIEDMIQKELDMGSTMEQAKKHVNAEIQQMIDKINEMRAALAAALAAANADADLIIPEAPNITEPPNPPGPGEGPQGGMHEGGIVTKHGDKRYSGVLKDTEVFSKLLKGEYVATEDQMKRFLRSTLPNIAVEVGNMFSEEEKRLKNKGESKVQGIPENYTKPPSFNIEAIKIISPTQRSSGELTRPITPNPRENTYGDMSFEMNINVEGSLDKTVLPKLKKDVIKEINKSLERRGIRRTADSFAI